MTLMLSEKFTWHKPTPSYSIATAVSITTDSNHNGTMERLAEALNKTINLLGQTLQLLHQKGLLSDQEILQLLPAFEKAEEE